MVEKCSQKTGGDCVARSAIIIYTKSITVHRSNVEIEIDPRPEAGFGSLAALHVVPPRDPFAGIFSVLPRAARK